MRVTSKKIDGVWIKAFAGSTGVLVAFNIDEPSRRGLLGFALERQELPADGKAWSEPTWLSGMLQFPGSPHEAGDLIPSNVAPIQKFRWSDYTVKPGTTYRYHVHPVYGELDRLRIHDGPIVTVTTMSADDTQFVIFNRAVAASQAFARKFPRQTKRIAKSEDMSPKGRSEYLKKLALPRAAMQWLSRGLEEQIVGFIGSAKKGEALDICIYELQWPHVCKAVKAAIDRGVDVRVLLHTKNDKTTTKNKSAVRAAKIPQTVITPRKPMNLMHDKFIVHSGLDNGDRLPQAVLTGSTNFTQNGIFYQGNVVHVIRRPTIARTYLSQFERVFATADKATETKKETTDDNPMDPDIPFFVGFSPRSDGTDLERFEDIIQRAIQDVMFLTVFKQIVPKILRALDGTPHDQILRIGLQNSATTITGYHKDRTAKFVTPAMIKTGLEGWLVEKKPSDQKGNLFIHTKIIVTDFTTDKPTIISGSHNFTNPGSAKNDENYLIIQCKTNADLDIADAYGVEIMRLYDHYRFRWFTQHASGKKTKKALKDPPGLAIDDNWTDDYFGGDDMKTADRERFCP